MSEATGAQIAYDEFAHFAENAAEFGIPYEGSPVVRRATVLVEGSRRISALVWGREGPAFVLLHGNAQNAHTWDTLALALDRSLVAIDLPGHGHSDAPLWSAGETLADAFAHDVAVVVDQLAPDATTVVGMSRGGLTAVALAALAPELVRRLVLVDVTPGVTREKAQAIGDFVEGPAEFGSFEEILARTVAHNPTRSEASLRRGILHNAIQAADGSWRWRYRRHEYRSGRDNSAESDRLWGLLSDIRVPLMLVRGMRQQSVVDDDDEAELLRRVPGARVEHVTDAGHSVQGDAPLELAALIADFTATT